MGAVGKAVGEVVKMAMGKTGGAEGAKKSGGIFDTIKNIMQDGPLGLLGGGIKSLTDMAGGGLSGKSQAKVDD